MTFQLTDSDPVAPIAPPTGVAPWVKRLHIPAMHRLGVNGAGVRVAIIDTGADLNHPYLAPAIVASASFVPGQSVDDGHGHGTHVAGIIRQAAPGASLIIAKAISDQDTAEDAWLAAAIRWCVAQGARIINASWGSPTEPVGDELHAAIREAVAAGVLFCAAAGNAGHDMLTIDTVSWPARWPEPLAVAATWQMFAHIRAGVASYSSAGPEVDVSAPGTDLVSCGLGGGWVAMSGTSMAAPVVAGVAALLAEDWERKTGRPPTEPELVTLILSHTRDISATGRDVLAGVGEINVAPLVEHRVVTITEGAGKVEFLEGNSLVRGEVLLDVPARMEQVTVNGYTGGRFFAEFRGLADALGASEVGWNSDKRPEEPVVGTAVIDVLPE